MPEIDEKQLATYKMKAEETTLNQHCVAVLDTATEGQCTRPADALAANIAGVLRDDELAAERTGYFQVAGAAKVKISAAVTIGDLLVIADVQGRVRPFVPGVDDSGTGYVGQALSAATTANSLVVCQLMIPCEYQS